jgi:signal transduction histidine kinase
MVGERKRDQKLEIVCRVPEQELVITADERTLKQCLLNLLSNAIKFSPEGGEIIAEIVVDPRNRTVISITDHGIGMSDEDKERALQPFGQANSTISRSFGGTGLGLSITNGLVVAHGGALEIESRLGEGTCVRIILPPGRTRQAPSARHALSA